MLKRLSLLILLAALSSAATAKADQGMTVKGCSTQALMCEPAPQFTTEQLERIHTIKSKYEESGDARHVELHKLHKQMIDALSQPNLDRATISSLLSKISSLENSEGQDRTQMLVELHDVLSTEQKAKLRAEFLQQSSMMRPPVPMHGGLLGLFLPPPPPLPIMMPPLGGPHFPPGSPSGPDR